MAVQIDDYMSLFVGHIVDTFLKKLEVYRLVSSGKLSAKEGSLSKTVSSFAAVSQSASFGVVGVSGAVSRLFSLVIDVKSTDEYKKKAIAIQARFDGVEDIEIRSNLCVAGVAIFQAMRDLFKEWKPTSLKRNLILVGTEAVDRIFSYISKTKEEKKEKNKWSLVDGGSFIEACINGESKSQWVKENFSSTLYSHCLHDNIEKAKYKESLLSKCSEESVKEAASTINKELIEDCKSMEDEMFDIMKLLVDKVDKMDSKTDDMVSLLKQIKLDCSKVDDLCRLVTLYLDKDNIKSKSVPPLVQESGDNEYNDTPQEDVTDYGMTDTPQEDVTDYGMAELQHRDKEEKKPKNSGAFYIKNLTRSAINKLCTELDPYHPISNWKTLARTVELEPELKLTESDIDQIERCVNIEKTPAFLLLGNIISSSLVEVSISNILEKLGTMKQNLVVAGVKVHCTNYGIPLETSLEKHYEIKKMIANKINEEIPVLGCWKDLADLYGISRQTVKYLGDVANSKTPTRPTENLLDAIAGRKPEFTVKLLACTLRKMGRNDVAIIVDNFQLEREKYEQQGSM